MTARIEPVALGSADATTRALLERLSTLRGKDTRLPNVFGTLAHHPDLLRSWLGFATYLLTSSTLESRLRELIVLRVGWLCRSRYEWGQHVLVGRSVGVTDDDLRRLAIGSDADGWTPGEAIALRAAEELIITDSISDATWSELAARCSRQQVLDLVFLVGQYRLVSAMLNALRVERDDGLDATRIPFPAS